jgi:glutamate-ammonia-ligase adenylyltransferase
MALSRARQVAGDAEFGARVLRVIERFVYSREADVALAAQMQEMRQRMEPQGKRRARIDIKRGPGGIVDIEFVAQILVLKWGYRDRGLRVGSTRHALRLLVDQGYLDPDQGHFLLDAYEYLRAVEKGMRLASERASDTLPTGRELEILSRALGTEDVAAFQDEVEARMQQTRRVFSVVFAELTN